MEAHRVAESGLPRARGAASPRDVPRRGPRGRWTAPARGLPGALSVARPPGHRLSADAGSKRPRGGLQADARRAAPQPDAARPRSLARGAGHRRDLAGQAQGSRAGAQSRARARAAPGALSLRNLRLQGTPVLLALSRLRRLGNLSAAAHGGIRAHTMTRTKCSA